MKNEERRKRCQMREINGVDHNLSASFQGNDKRKIVPSASFSSSSSIGYIALRKETGSGAWINDQKNSSLLEYTTKRIAERVSEFNQENDARVGQHSNDQEKAQFQRRRNSLDKKESYGCDEFTELIPSIDCMNLAVDFGRERLVEKEDQSRKEKEELDISFQDARSFLKKQEEDEFLAELPPPSTDSTDPPSSDWIEKGNVVPSAAASLADSERETLEIEKPLPPRAERDGEKNRLKKLVVSAHETQNTHSRYKELRAYKSDQNLAEAQKYTCEARAFTACVNSRLQDILNYSGCHSTQDDDSVIEVIKRGPPGIKVALGELNGLLSDNSRNASCSMKGRDIDCQRNSKSHVQTQEKQNSQQFFTRANSHISPSEQNGTDRHRVRTEFRNAEDAENGRDMPIREIKETSRNRDQRSKNKCAVRLGHFAASLTEVDSGEVSSSSGWTEKFFGLSFSSNASCLGDDDLELRNESNVDKCSSESYRADNITTSNTKTRLTNKMDSIAENMEDGSMDCLQVETQRNKSNICAGTERCVTLPTKGLNRTTDNEQNGFMKLDVKRKHCKQQSSKVNLPRYEDIQPHSAFMRDSRYCRRLLCSIGDSIKENISFTNRSHSTARICFSLLPLSTGCHQYTISPAVLDIPAGARRDFSLEFKATCAGVSAGILQFRGIDANTLFAPYEVLIEACVKERNNVTKGSCHESNPQTTKKSFPEDKPSLIKIDNPTQIEELNEDDEDKELVEISPTFIRFNTNSINGETIVPDGNMSITNHSNSSIPFKISCIHENIQINPKQGVVDSKCNVSIIVSPISRPFLRENTRRRSLGVEKNTEQQRSNEGKASADVWYGSFTVQVGTSLSREISIVVEPSALEILPSFESTARRRHGLRNQTDSFYYTRKMNRQGLYFHARAVECGNCPIAEFHQVPVYICNGSNNPMTVFLQELSPPFYCSYTTTTIQPRKFIEVPVSFTPKVKGKVSTSLHAYSLTDKASVTLIARGV